MPPPESSVTNSQGPHSTEDPQYCESLERSRISYLLLCSWLPGSRLVEGAQGMREGEEGREG